jgi:hypothetical protein
MDLVEVTVLKTLDDRNPAKPDRKQLPPRHHPMLPPRQPRYLLIFCASGQFDIDSASN